MTVEDNQSNLILAIEVGNDQEYTTVDGLVYVQDQFFSQNTKIADYQGIPEIVRYTKEQTVFKTERHADETFSYALPLPEAGVYTLVLQFAEMFFKEAGKRVFNVRFGECLVEKDVDIVKEVGFMSALELFIEFELIDNNFILLNGQTCETAMKENQLLVVFEKIGIDNPKVDGIMLYYGGVENTHQESYKELINVWDDLQKEASRVQETQEFKTKQSRQKIQEDDDDDDLVVEKQELSEFIFSKFGLMIGGLLLLFIIVMCLLDNSNKQKKA